MPSPTESCRIQFAGHELLLDANGALYWPQERLLLVSDLHLEKASFLAQFGSMIPRYDTRDTLSRLERLILHYQPQQLVCLGDSFHDAKACSRLAESDHRHLSRLAESVTSWHWVLGNHDPALPSWLPGQCVPKMDMQGISLVHEPEAHRGFQIIGHFHPKLSLVLQGHKITGKVFAQDDKLLLMPAFGAYTGGLDVQHEALTSRLSQPDYYLMYREKIWKV